MTVKKNILLSGLSGLLLGLAWYPYGFSFLIFVAFVPLFFVVQSSTNIKQTFLYACLCFLIWNVIDTYWVYYASETAIAAFFINTLLMCLPVLALQQIKKRIPFNTALFFFVPLYLLFEWLHQTWQISWPWLHLGNVWASNPEWVKWYSYTGSAGGTLWILVSNVLIFTFTTCYINKQKWLRWAVTSAVFVLLPLLLSYLAQNQVSKQIQVGKQVQVIVVQPNIDPYQKLESNTVQMQIDKLIDLSFSRMDATKPTVVIWPETALIQSFDEAHFQQQFIYDTIIAISKKFKKLSIITGAETYAWVNPEQCKQARQAPNGKWYAMYNSSVLIEHGEIKAIHHKNKLVPGVEALPDFLQFLGPLFEKFGGTASGYAKDDSLQVFVTQHGLKVAPLVCFESVFGLYVSKYVSEGVNCLAIMTNDGWWNNTAGYKQHFQYAKLRAIENNLPILRSANTGISAIIHADGTVAKQTKWDEATTIQSTLTVQEPQLTWFNKYPNLLYLINAAALCFGLVWWMTKRRKL